ncbi:DNA repair protein XRCC2-like isoform X2 [Dreissena polymorpha]|uniref:DNA repair protein XRCC2-like isoform X2 n=1 Tax=Dreissena polymorpha TaxID=45954 RepID=UPI0022643CCD|nr:DNA repair protein XRCC2-like isoform X2 [Dreissena polymorpha]
MFLARLGTRPHVSGIEADVFGSGPQCKDVIEIYGEEGTGKSEFLSHLIVQCILPEAWSSIDLGGRGASVIFIDTEYKFSILRLVSLMEKQVLQKLADCGKEFRLDASQIEVFIEECLERLYIVRCSSSEELVITLHSLEGVICNDPNISLVMIDSISAFYWLDRSLGGDSIPAQEANLKLTVEALTKLVNTYNLVLFATKSAVYKKKSQDSVGFDRGSGVYDMSNTGCGRNCLSEDLDLLHAEFMCKPWQRFVSHRLILVKDTGNQASDAGNQTFVIGGDCVKGNQRFKVTQAGFKLVDE